MDNQTKIMITGVGNELRQDDAFGVLLAQKLLTEAVLPSSVKVLETGSAGIHLVQELFDKYDVLIILDVVAWGGKPGEIHFKEIEVKDIREFPAEEKNEFLADAHYINPLKALMLAKALDVLPAKVIFFGCETAENENIGIGMSEAVANAIPVGFKKVSDLIESIMKEKSGV
jgi:hydrogenase maturation protease